VDVVTNFIAERNPILQLLVSICFIHPKCYPFDTNLKSDNYTGPVTATGEKVVTLLLTNRRESARDLIIDVLNQVQVNIKTSMFKQFSKEVARNGKTVEATKNIIDSVKVIWETTNTDLESAKTSIRELFYLLNMESQTEINAVAEICETALEIPDFVDAQYSAAISDESNNKRKSRNFGVWDSVLNR
jgi:hypothetical protein